jgi:ribonuclease P protein component
MNDEAHLPAEQSRAQAPARLPGAVGHPERPQNSRCAPGARPQVTVGLSTNPPNAVHPATLTRRADFLAANRGGRAPMPGFVLLVRPRHDGDSRMRVGYTVTKKIGGAVVRNRMKRRLRALVREILPGEGIAGADHVLVGRAGGIERDFAALRRELSKALAKARR